MGGTRGDEAVAELARISLFTDLTRPELHEIDRVFEEEVFDRGRRILRRGIGGSNFHVIVEGLAVVEVDGEEHARLTAGDFFGEISILLGEPSQADVTADTQLRCRVLPATQFESFLVQHPRVIYRMLQAEALRLRSAGLWPQ